MGRQQCRFRATTIVLTLIAVGADASANTPNRWCFILDDFATCGHTIIHAEDLSELIGDRDVNGRPLIVASMRSPKDSRNLFPKTRGTSVLTLGSTDDDSWCCRCGE
jgi:hypothetical protein